MRLFADRADGRPDPSILLNTDVESAAMTVELRPRRRFRGRALSLVPLSAAFIFAIFYSIPILQSYPTVHSALSIVVAATYLWATEGLPVFATAYCVPVLAVWLGTGLDSATHLRASGAARARAFAYSFMEPVVFVFLGSMTISACLAKLSLTDRFIDFVHRHLSKKPAFVLLAVMLMNTTIGGFISPAAASTMVLEVTLPIIRSLAPDERFIKALLFGVAWSGNCGGMPTCIASPQNLMALRNVLGSDPAAGSQVTVVKWMSFGIPVAFTIVFVEWLYLLLRFRPPRTTIKAILGSTDKRPWKFRHTFATVMTGLTIVLWSLESALPDILGNIGITALIPVVAFFGSGLLNEQDFHGLKWHTLALMGGGLALGEAMTESNLLTLFSDQTRDLFRAIPLWPLLFVTLIITGVFASLMNSTAASAILYPFIRVIGDSHGHADMFICLSAMMISGAQLFHMSSFANALVASVLRHQEAGHGRLTSRAFLERKDFTILAWPITLILAPLIVASIGFGICLAGNIA